MWQYLNRGISTVIAIGIILIAALMVGGTAYWQYTETQKEKSQMTEMKIAKEKKKMALSLEDIKNAEYYIPELEKKVNFIDGNYEELIEDEEVSFTVIAGIYGIGYDAKATFGDLDGDSDEDAIVAFYVNTGGTGTWIHLAAFLNENGESVFSDSEMLGDRTVIESMSIKDRIINLDLVIHGPEDPMCCPTLEKSVQYQLAGPYLVEVK